MRIGVFCSGGDAPGMNACVRAIVRTAVPRGHEVIGINRGYQGLLAEDFFRNDENQPQMKLRCVSGWNHLGGAKLFSSRSEEFRSENGQQKAAGILRRHQFDALIPIGGDGTFTGAIQLAKCWSGQIVGCPGTIDNDLRGTDFTIGFSTAVETAVSAVDKLRDTAESHERMFLVEVMGRHNGYIAVYTALASGAEIIAIPETPTDFPEIVEQLIQLKSRGKKSIIMIVSEGDEKGGAIELAKNLAELNCPYQTRVVILGHVQRGGRPTPEDRFRASLMGSGAVSALEAGATGIMIGTENDRCIQTPLTEVIAGGRPIPPDLIALLEQMAS